MSKRMNFRKSSKSSKKLCCTFWTFKQDFCAWICKKKRKMIIQNWGWGGQRPFETFQKVHPYLYHHPSLGWPYKTNNTIKVGSLATSWIFASRFQSAASKLTFLAVTIAITGVGQHHHDHDHHHNHNHHQMIMVALPFTSSFAALVIGRLFQVLQSFLIFQPQGKD